MRMARYFFGAAASLAAAAALSAASLVAAATLSAASLVAAAALSAALCAAPAFAQEGEALLEASLSAAAATPAWMSTEVGDAWAKGGYSFPAPGQIMRIGATLWDGIGGRVQFAGEHCSYAFVGFMEGALHSGAAAAKRVATQLGVA